MQGASSDDKSFFTLKAERTHLPGVPGVDTSNPPYDCLVYLDIYGGQLQAIPGEDETATLEYDGPLHRVLATLVLADETNPKTLQIFDRIEREKPGTQARVHLKADHAYDSLVSALYNTHPNNPRMVDVAGLAVAETLDTLRTFTFEHYENTVATLIDRALTPLTERAEPLNP
ncbi:MAG TPA: hypothetical protein VK674_01215 [Candidatus Limnocylindria bacterium]|nr:hypothetical protein [Candidatus Limnocylindria bacterium]